MVTARSPIRYAGLLVLFLLLGLAAYSTVIGAFFLADDFIILDAISRRGPFGWWTRSEGHFFRPVISLSLYADYRLWGRNPAGYHVTNILFHAANAFLVFLATGLLMPVRPGFKSRSAVTKPAFAGSAASESPRGEFVTSGGDLNPRSTWGVPLFAGLLFLFLHSHTEAVSWIAGRTDVIAAFFALSAFVCYLLYKQRGNRAYLGASLGLILGGLLSKESVIAFPLLIGAYELYEHVAARRPARALSRALSLPALYFGLVAVYFAIRYAALGTILGKERSSIHFGFEPLLIALNLVFYPLRTLVPYLPLQSAPDDLIPNVSFGTLLPLAALGGIAVLCALGFTARRLARGIPREEARPGALLLLFLAGAFYLALLPVINLGISLLDTQDERFVYFPSVFGAIFVAVALGLVIRSERRFRIVALSLVLLSGLALLRANEGWRAAGEISRGVLQSVVEAGPARRLFLVNVPDRIQGAYIYRTGIAEAIRFWGHGDRFEEVIPVSYIPLYEPEDGTAVTRRAGAYSIGLSNPRAFFTSAKIPLDQMARTEYYELRDFRKDRYDLVFKQMDSEDRLLVYSGGRMERVGLSGEPARVSVVPGDRFPEWLRVAPILAPGG